MPRQALVAASPFPVFLSAYGPRQAIVAGAVYANETSPQLYTPAAGSVAISGLTPSGTDAASLTPGAGSLAITGLTPSEGDSVSFAPGPGSLAISGLTPSASEAASLTPAAGSLAITGLTPGASGAQIFTPALRVVAPRQALIAAQPYPVFLSETNAREAIAARTVFASETATRVGGLVITGWKPALSGAWLLQPGAGTVLLSGWTPALHIAGLGVALTSLPLPWTASLSLQDYGGDETPTGLGGAQQRFIRVGSRWSCTFSSLPALGAACAQALLAARFKARAQGLAVVASWPQGAFPTAIGAPAVQGGGQAGPTLSVRGLTPGTTALTAGLFFSVVVAGQYYLYCLASDVAVDGSGNATIAVAPWLRAPPLDGATLEFAAPQIEGFIRGNTDDWTIDRLAWVSLPSFTIDEAA